MTNINGNFPGDLKRDAAHDNAASRHANFPDGTHFLTGSGESTPTLWPTDYHDTIRYLCGVLTRDLMPDELAV